MMGSVVTLAVFAALTMVAVLLPRSASAFATNPLLLSYAVQPPPRSVFSSTARHMVADMLPTTTTDKAEHASKGGCPVGFGTKTKDTVEQMFDVPSIFSPSDSRPIVLFDGSCNLCNAAVRLLLDYDSCKKDSRGNLRVAALQSRVGELLCARMPEGVREEVLAPVATKPSKKKGASSKAKGEGEKDKGEEEEEEVEKYRSIVVVTPTQTLTQTRAVLYIGRSLGGKLKPLRYLSFAGYVIPPFIRNRLYKFVSRRRRRWFGNSEECRLFDDNFDERYVDDGILTGNFRDPFGDPHAPPTPAPSVDESNLPELPQTGDKVRIIWPTGQEEPHTLHYLPERPNGLCVVGATGIVGTVDPPRRVVVKLDREELGLEKGDEGEVIRAPVTAWEVVKVEG